MYRFTAITMLVAATTGGCVIEDDCRQLQCGVDIGEGFTNNGRTFSKCYVSEGAGVLTTTLTDEDGKLFFECTNNSAGECTEGTVDAEFAYCGVR